MATTLKLISIFLSLFLLTQCNTKQESNRKTSDPSTTVRQAQSSLTGVWKYSNTIWYSSELILHNDGTFTFHDQGCYGQRFSLGKWTRLDGSIFLTSFNTFKSKEEKSLIKTVQLEEPQNARGKIKNSNSGSSFVQLSDIQPPVMRGPHDTVRVYLSKVQLQLRKDTLFCIGSNTLPGQAKFCRGISR